MKEVKGPPAKIAFDEDGNLSKAGQGFAKKQGISEKDIFKQDIGGTEYLYAKIEEKGKKTSEVLQSLVPEVVLKLQGSHFMRWADFDIKFSRPIRWIVSLLDNEEVKLKIENVESTKFSRGHRFYEKQDIEITNADTYFDELYTAKVIVDQKQREEEIIKQAKEISKTVEGEVKLDPELVKEVTYILEWPVPVLCSFEEKYLEIPDDVTVTVMASHQRYFPVYDKKGKLLNNFITMANYIGDAFDNIRAGNERVIRARLDDAIFFYKEDNKKTLESRVEELKGVTFQKQLGSIYDKVNRIKEVSYFIATEMDQDKQTIEDIERTALLCKADLVTNLVFEFTELQGFIGADYAKLHGDNEQVSVGVKEHYFPISADGDLAESITGQVVGIADKVDTICGVFAVGKIPTGSADPLGLRRAALGVLRTIMDKNLDINLSEVIKNSIDMQPVTIEDKAKLISAIEEFITQRLKIFVSDKYKHDVIDAAISAKNPLANLKDFIERADILSVLVQKENYPVFHESANRIARIIKSQEIKTEVDAALFVAEAEKELWNCVKEIAVGEISYSELVEKLESSIPAIEKFFEDVLVMDKDEKIKDNRVSMLYSLLSKFLEIGDFSKIVA